jgi:hypothetical protein
LSLFWTQSAFECLAGENLANLGWEIIGVLSISNVDDWSMVI